MVVATYHGGNRDNSVYDYTDWFEWVDAIKEDFRKFIDYKLVDVENSKNLIKELKNASRGLLNKCPYRINHTYTFNIDVGDTYTIFEYPVIDFELNRYNCNYVIISRDYREFIFVDNEDSAPLVKVYKVDGIVSEEKIIPGIDLEWDEYLIEHNLDYLRGKKDSIKELGGFAEEQTDVDGDYKSFNYCLASDYATAMVNEDFESLGEMDYELFKTITYWLNYDGKIGSSDEDFISKIPSGNFMTTFGRTFAEAVCQRRLGEFAQNMVYGGNKNPRVYFTAIAYSTCYQDILNHILSYKIEPSEYVSFAKELMSIINQEYLKLSESERTPFVEQLKKYLRKMVAAQIKSFLENKDNYEWFNEAFGIKDKKIALTDKKKNVN